MCVGGLGVLERVVARACPGVSDKGPVRGGGGGGGGCWLNVYVEYATEGATMDSPWSSIHMCHNKYSRWPSNHTPDSATHS